MLSKRNKKELMRKVTDQRQRFSIRKYAVGAASVLIGLTFLGGYTTTAHAATNGDGTQAAVAQNSSNTKASNENLGG